VGVYLKLFYFILFFPYVAWKTLCLKDPSPIITTPFEIGIAFLCSCCNTTNTLKLYNECKTKKEGHPKPCTFHAMLAHPLRGLIQEGQDPNVGASLP
jgi:hypothetical protein